MSAPLDISTREKLVEATEWILESDVILCVQGRRAYSKRVLEELARVAEAEKERDEEREAHELSIQELLGVYAKTSARVAELEAALEEIIAASPHAFKAKIIARAALAGKGKNP